MEQHANLQLIERFFNAYSQRDLAALREVLADDAHWIFPGDHALSGTHSGIDAIVAFFDAVGSAMGQSLPHVERLVMGVSDQYVVECQQIQTNRAGAPNLDQTMCVLWRFANGMIILGQHLAADEAQLNAFYESFAA